MSIFQANYHFDFNQIVFVGCLATLLSLMVIFCQTRNLSVETLCRDKKYEHATFDEKLLSQPLNETFDENKYK